VHLLHGVTGSGKTEVYLRLIERVLGRGGAAIVLVPEIALTPQTGQRFVGRFGSERVAVLHSGLTASQRNRAWHRVRAGDARVVVGARSAVFAPVRDLRLIVVDEEHDPSYKQDQLPRYHARDLAIKRAQIEGEHAGAGGVCVLGSATPSLESWQNATGPGGKFGLWTLPERATGSSPPRVEIVALAVERRRRAEMERDDPSPLVTRDGLYADNIGPTLEAALRETIAEGGQAMLLLNRRGFASHVACPARTCGWTLGCDHCSAKLVLHRLGVRPGQQAPRGFLRCHHCLAEQLCPMGCPICGKRTVLVGSGTQRLESELAARLGLEPGRDFVRVDGDTMTRMADYFSVLSRFAQGVSPAGEAGGSVGLKVLLGTQMLAKGLDFPNVRLVGVINADTGLAIPDFRSSERTFQLVSQVAGRAGRGVHAGRVIVQTMSPEEPAIVLAASHSFAEFASRELETRRMTGYPPVARMVRIVTRDPEPEAAERRARAIASAMRGLEGSGLRIEGPMPCAVAKVSDHYRFEVQVFGADARGPQRVMGTLRSRGLLLSDARTAVDVDPVSLM